MGRVLFLIFAFVGSDQPINDYDSKFHRDTHVFAERGLKKAYKSSVIISAFGDGIAMTSGSGNYMQIDGKKFVLTALHVVQGREDIFITEKGGANHIAKLKYADPVRDIAILEISRPLKYTKAIEYRSVETNHIGREVFYCGHPENTSFMNFKGIIGGTDSQWLMLNIFAWPGSSGSVIFDSEGDVVGVVSAVSISDPTGVAVLVPNIVRVGPTSLLSRDMIVEALSE